MAFFYSDCLATQFVARGGDGYIVGVALDLVARHGLGGIIVYCGFYGNGAVVVVADSCTTGRNADVDNGHWSRSDRGGSLLVHRPGGYESIGNFLPPGAASWALGSCRETRPAGTSGWGPTSLAGSAGAGAYSVADVFPVSGRVATARVTSRSGRR